MKSFIIIIAIILVAFLGIYFFAKNSFKNDRKINWNLELTKPLDYNISINNISYFRADKEINRYTALNSFSGWSGSPVGRVLHNKATEYLPDTVNLSWKEIGTGKNYIVQFEFPKQAILDYWNENYEMQQEKWGADYPQGQLALKLGIAPEGNIILWMSDLDINTSGFAIEIESYKAAANDNATEQKVNSNLSYSVSRLRFGSPHFNTIEEKNVVAIRILYYNGESNSINMKSKNGSILERINMNRGWGLAKEITVHWFDKGGVGYKSKYEIAFEDIPIIDSLEGFRYVPFIYLLDRPNTSDEEWNKWENKHIFHLNEIRRDTI